VDSRPFAKGSVLDVEERTAQSLIRAGYAEPVTEPADELGAAETATAPPAAETTAMPAPKRRRGLGKLKAAPPKPGAIMDETE
jgi:hypothetical protein